MRISFDYDGVLSTFRGTELAKKLISQGNIVYIISARSNKMPMYNKADLLDIPHERIFATGSNKKKIQKVMELNIDKHYDNNSDVVKELKSVGHQFFDGFDNYIFAEIEEILNHPKLSDEYKFDEIQELIFKKWRGMGSLKSSNVKNIMYNDDTKEMFIQFQDKSIYTYFNVSFDLFLKVSGGKATCITTGENKYGKWYKGKSPSVGAAVHKYLVKSGISYKKGGSLK